MPGVSRVGPGCGEVDVVHSPEPGVLRVDRLVGVVDRRHERETGVQYPALGLVFERDGEVVEFDDGVEVAAPGEVVADLAQAQDLDRGVEAGAVRRYVLEGHRAGRTVLDLDVHHHQSGRGVQPDRGDRLDDLDHPGLHQHGGHPDGAVAAHRQAAGDLDEQHPPVRVRARRRLQDRPAHGGVSPRLEHQQGADPVQVFHEVAAPVGHGPAGNDADPAGDDPGRHALGVGVDGMVDGRAAHGGSPFSVSLSWSRGLGLAVSTYRYTGLSPAQPRPSARAFSVARVTAACCSAVSGERGGRQPPPASPARSIDSLMAWTNSVRESQRSSGCSAR